MFIKVFFALFDVYFSQSFVIMSPLSFAGKVAIITGAGGALGKSYALDLAKRGCSLVVNDVGALVTGEANSNTGKLPSSAGITCRVRITFSSSF